MSNDLHLDPTPAANWPVPPQSPTPHSSVFKGRFGLRAGWGILLFILFFALSAFTANVIHLAAQGKLRQTFTRHGSAPPASPAANSTGETKVRGTVIGETVAFLSVGVASFLLSRIERRRIGAYGIGSNRRADFLPGAAVGLASLSLLVLVLKSLHLLVFDGRALYGTAAALYGLKWLLAFLLVGLFEEYINRGYLQYTLMRGVLGLAEAISLKHARAIAFWLAAIVMSTLFGSGHLANPGENPVGIAMVFVAGMLFSYALWRTGSLWWAIGFHMAWDWAQSFLYGVPDSGQVSAGRLYLTHPVGKAIFSGGSDGPEGSIYVIPTLLLVALIIRFTTRPGPQPPLEPVSKFIGEASSVVA